MKNLFFLGALILFLASCTNVNFVSPQPEYIDALTEIPEKYHGEFVDQSGVTYIVDDNTVTVCDKDTIEMELGDTLIIKERGNFLFLNTLENNIYTLCAIKYNEYLNYTNLQIYFPKIIDNAYLFDILEKNGDWHITYLIDNVSVNQMSVLLKEAPVDMSLIRLK